jgi:hypothetical protein
MKKLLNCWEFHGCGRVAGGDKVHVYGICPVTTEKKADGIHGGKNGGRACWAIAGTFCEGKIQGSFAEKRRSCLDCAFFQEVLRQNDFTLLSVVKILKKIGKK